MGLGAGRAIWSKRWARATRSNIGFSQIPPTGTEEWRERRRAIVGNGEKYIRVLGRRRHVGGGEERSIHDNGMQEAGSGEWRILAAAG